MSTGLPLSITYLPGPVPLSTHIPAATLAQCFDAAAIVDAAKQEARTILKQAEEMLACAHAQAEQIRAEAHRQSAAEAMVELAQKQAALVDETVQWLIDEDALETAITTRIEARVRTLVKQTVEPFLNEQDSVELLLRRIHARLRQDRSTAAMTLRVAPAVSARVRSELQSDKRLAITEDDALGTTQAILETPFVILRFDLDEHLQILLSRLNGMTSFKELADAQ